jgi:hypothetical protein
MSRPDTHLGEIKVPLLLQSLHLRGLFLDLGLQRQQLYVRLRNPRPTDRGLASWC